MLRIITAGIAEINGLLFLDWHILLDSRLNIGQLARVLNVHVLALLQFTRAHGVRVLLVGHSVRRGLEFFEFVLCHFQNSNLFITFI